jgi:hypothetical protein
MEKGGGGLLHFVLHSLVLISHHGILVDVIVDLVFTPIVSIQSVPAACPSFQRP